MGTLLQLVQDAETLPRADVRHSSWKGRVDQALCMVRAPALPLQAAAQIVRQIRQYVCEYTASKVGTAMQGRGVTPICFSRAHMSQGNRRLALQIHDDARKHNCGAAYRAVCRTNLYCVPVL